jgi:surfeit locus 1 family protein
MSLRVPLGRGRVFAPSPLFTLLMLALAGIFVALGRWQWHRGTAREVVYARYARGARHLLDVGSQPLFELPDFQRVRIEGTLDGAHQFLLDNSTWHGLDGYQVLTPLERPNGRIALVDRGWVRFTGSRRHLPDVALAASGPVTLTGRLGSLPVAGLQSGRAPPPPGNDWPKVTSFPSMRELSAALGHSLEPRILLLDPGEPHGYVRDWHPPGMPAMRNFGYAFQWWCFAALALVLWGVIGTRRRVPAAPAGNPP